MRLAFLLYLALLWLLANPASAAVERPGTTHPVAPAWLVPTNVTPCERALFQDAADGNLDQHSLIQAVLIACGAHESAELVDLQLHAAAWLDRLRLEFAGSNDARWKAAQILERLHVDLLQDRYRTECSDLRQLLQAGDYNCVGAAVMYVAACEACGLTVAPQELPGHVRCRVWMNDHWQVVEPTCRDWLSETTDTAQRDRANAPAALQAAYKLTDEGRTLSAIGLVAMIYYNQGLDRLDERDWSGAFAANQKALRIDPASRSARANLLAIWNNWALQVSDAGDHRSAARMLERGVQLAPEFSTFQLNLSVIQQRQQDIQRATLSPNR